MAHTFKCIFYIYRWSASRQVPQVFNQSTCATIGQTHISTNTNSIDVGELFNKANSKLQKCLKWMKIRHFIPLRKPTIETSVNLLGENEISVVYYHNDDTYHTIYESAPGMVLMPTGDLYKHLSGLLELHGFDGWEDERTMASD